MPLEPQTLSWLTLAAAAISVLALVVAAVALRRVGRASARSGRARPRAPAPRPAAATGPSADGIDGLRQEVAALRFELSDALRHLAVVRYDAFGDMGGQLSWSLALLDDAGDGVVLTSIHGRSDSRTYAKNIRRWTCEQQLSPEEAEAVDFARADRAA